MRQNFDFELLVDLCRKTHVEMQRRSVRAVDTGLAARNWLLGWYIVEYEQKGADRAVYGSGLLKKLSSELGKGFSIRSLRQFRAFYMHQKAIRQTPSAESLSGVNILKSKALEIRQTLSAELAKALPLGWSHYIALLTVDNPDERRFYEIEAVQNG